MPTKPTIKTLQRDLNNANEALEMALAVSGETDNNFFTGGLTASYTDRTNWNRKKIFSEALRAWRVNPIARRIVRLLRSFIIGKGISIKSDDPGTNTFLQAWWNDPLNNLPKNIKRWKDEESRTGNLFFLFSVQENGMTHIRAVPAETIDEIETKENDIEQETLYTRESQLDKEPYKAYDPQSKDQQSFMLHFASNQPVGTPWGESDLTPLLVWIGRYASWLEDRVRLNKYRTAFMYVISGTYTSELDRAKREKYLNSHPPKSGSVLVLNRAAGEAWGILSAKLDAFDATTDGTSIKKIISAGIGFPLHYLAEPESSTRTTAEAAGTPTFRTLEEMQDDFFEMIIAMARVALAVRALKDKTIKLNSKLEITGPDITERDNANLALALSRTEPALADMFDRELIDSQQFVDLAYKTMAEPFEGTAPKGKRKPLTAPGTVSPATEPDPEDDKEPE